MSTAAELEYIGNIFVLLVSIPIEVSFEISITFRFMYLPFFVLQLVLIHNNLINHFHISHSL